MINYKTEFYEKIKPNYQDYEERLPLYWLQTYSDRLERIKYHLKIVDTSNLSILDVGCGSGRALSYFKQLGAPKVFGVEPSALAVSRSKLSKNEIVASDFFEWEPPKQFDVIYIEQVLSHVPEDAKFLTKAISHCKDSGIIVIEEPNDFNDLQLHLENNQLIDKKYWIVKDHVHYYNHLKLTNLLDKCGFEVIEMQSTWPMEWFEISGDSYIGDDAKGKIVHEKRFKMLNALTHYQRMKLARCFAMMGIGRDVVLYAAKKATYEHQC